MSAAIRIGLFVIGAWAIVLLAAITMNWSFWFWFLVPLGVPMIGWPHAAALTLWCVVLGTGYHTFKTEDIWKFIDLSHDRNDIRMVHAIQVFIIIILVWGAGALLSLLS